MNGVRRPWGSLLFVPWLALAAAACGHAETGAAPAPATKASAEHGEAAPVSTSCGKTGLPDCPLQAWMKSTLQPSLKAGDLARLSAALDELSRVEPPGFEGWAASARAAATAARRGDVEAVRAECRACHERLRSRFRAEMRGARLL